DGKNGYCINSQQTNLLVDKIKALADKTDLYQNFSSNAIKFANLFQRDVFNSQINQAFIA
ncbi:MAG: hypothetical protein AB8G86_26045, partial [Saprospiraceae bacterium]